jgi:hypothetical protein
MITVSGLQLDEQCNAANSDQCAVILPKLSDNGNLIEGLFDPYYERGN